MKLLVIDILDVFPVEKWIFSSPRGLWSHLIKPNNHHVIKAPQIARQGLIPQRKNVRLVCDDKTVNRSEG